MDQIEGPESRPRISRIVKKPLLLLASCLLAALPMASTLAQSGNARQLPMTELPLNELSAFKPAAGNWKIAGDVTADLDKKGVLNPGKGQGVLVNLPDDKNKDNLTSTFEHGDMDLELDFLMAAGSNSGIYLQGRYEIQLLDSWGVRNPKAGDCGGITNGGTTANRRPEGLRRVPAPPQRRQSPRPVANDENLLPGPPLRRERQKDRQCPHAARGPQRRDDSRKRGTDRPHPWRENGDEKAMGPLLIQGDHGQWPSAASGTKTTPPPRYAGRHQYGYYPGQVRQVPNLQSLKAERKATCPNSPGAWCPTPKTASSSASPAR
jgi:hypothetical protein